MATKNARLEYIRVRFILAWVMLIFSMLLYPRWAQGTLGASLEGARDLTALRVTAPLQFGALAPGGGFNMFAHLCCDGPA